MKNDISKRPKYDIERLVKDHYYEIGKYPEVLTEKYASAYQTENAKIIDTLKEKYSTDKNVDKFIKQIISKTEDWGITDANVYEGKVYLSFLVSRGSIKAQINFGKDSLWEFNSNFWGGKLGKSMGVGFGFWSLDFIEPCEDEEMSFQINSTHLKTGELSIMWWRHNEPVIGNIYVFLKGVGLIDIAGYGTGVWNKI